MAAGNEALSSVRLDKWLWAARFFKQRQMAVEAITGGHIHVNGDRVKPARPIRPGDELRIRKGVETWVVTVLGLNDKRRPAKEAVLLYQEDEHHKEQREENMEMRKLHGVNIPTRKPDKRQRRKLGEFKQNWE
uniref:Heat shock protein 15 n=1 Tax=uncultured Thiotrichaceae bacterium TaxID=298394 RepID=A0A6S6UGD4_9GAMM|nr:MAG: Ribosome-associated heat shock protein implicated in the recycling of the 50S subunit (S4 paralog) [uncultured Thiotrichaceae bacterium]